MAALRETRDRINSVRSTLKITSAMKLVASAKLRKAQKLIEALRPYERTLGEILAAVERTKLAAESSRRSAGKPSPNRSSTTAIVVIASNSSMCGGFNVNVLHKALETIQGCEGEVEVYPIGRKIADGLRREGYTCPDDWNDLIGHPAYDKSSLLARSLSDRFVRGNLSRVLLVYTSFRSVSRHEPVVEEYLPFVPAKVETADQVREVKDYILEPDAETLIDRLLPQVLLLKFHAAILDSAAAEHAARTIAMQAATDNGEELLGELTLEYNKRRQQKITSEILDLLGGDQNR